MTLKKNKIITIDRIFFFKRKIFFKQKFVFKGKEIFYKEVIFIKIVTNFKVFFLEVAPLPQYQEIELQKYFLYLRKWRAEIEKKSFNINSKNIFKLAKQWTKIIPFPTLQWAISSLIFSFYFFFKNKNSFNVKNNILIPNLKKQCSENSSKNTLNHPVYKIKIGREKIEQEIFYLKKIFAKLKENQKVRLDGNQLWTKQQLIFFLKEVKNDLNFIEYIEEPIKINLKKKLKLKNFNQESLIFLNKNINFAIDESLLENEFETLKPIIKKNYSVIILKPSFIGSIEKLNEWINWAKQNQIKIIISSAFETEIGHEMIFRLITFFNLEKSYHGADTFRFLKSI